MGGFIPGLSIFGTSIVPEITSLADPIINWFVKKLKNACTKKINKNIIEDAGLNIISKNIKKRIPSITGLGVTLTYNEIKYIMKVIKSLENRGILL